MQIKKRIYPDPETTAPVMPKRLAPGDTIGIVAPASPFDRAEFDRGIAALKAMGFCVSIPEGLFNRNGYLAGSDHHRADLVNRCFRDPSIKAVLCARGGYGSMRMLSYLDFESIRKNPKIFAGFSDVSALLSVLYTHCGLVTFHAPAATTLDDTASETMDSMLKAFCSGESLEFRLRNGIALRDGSATGPVSGGNLTTLCHLVGTPFAPRFNGQILFLEDRGEAPYRIDRMLTQMKLAGCFEGIAGLVLGSFTDCGNISEIYRIVDDIFSEYPIPMLAGLEVGHDKTNMTIPLGLAATLDADRHLLSFHNAATLSGG
jgi:muramoyltetrapeptide carboxypeptidase